LATTKQAYRPLGGEEIDSAEFDDLEDRNSQKSRWPSISNLVLSITTIIFGLHSIYLSLQANCNCLEKEHLAFDDGYFTEWGELSPYCAVSWLIENSPSKIINRAFQGKIQRRVPI
jgi:hypothetical protein